MNCAFHPDVENTAFCIRCGKPLCAQCVRQVQSSIYCENCLIEISNPPGVRRKLPPAQAPRANPVGRRTTLEGAARKVHFFSGLFPGWEPSTTPSTSRRLCTC